MFSNNRKKQIVMIQQLQFTSKASLKKQCLFMTQGNIKEAKELYDFLVEDMTDLPATDPIPPTWQDSTRSTVNGIMSWIQQNQGTISQGIDYVRGLFAKNVDIAEDAAEPLPAIN